MTLTDLVKGDEHVLEFNIRRDITDYIIRFEMYDKWGNHRVKLLSDDTPTSPIDVTNASAGLFTVTVPKDSTTDFDDVASFEIEIESPTGSITTIFPGEKNEIIFLSQHIDWTTP